MEGTIPIICVKPDEDAVDNTSNTSGVLQAAQQDDVTHVLGNQDAGTGDLQLVTNTTSETDTHQGWVRTEPVTITGDNVGDDDDDDVGRTMYPPGPVTWIQRPKDEPDTPITWVAYHGIPNGDGREMLPHYMESHSDENNEETNDVVDSKQSIHIDNAQIYDSGGDCFSEPYNERNIKTENIDLKTESDTQMWQTESETQMLQTENETQMLQRESETQMLQTESKDAMRGGGYSACASSSALGREDRGTDRHHTRPAIHYGVDVVKREEENTDAGVITWHIGERLSAEEHSDDTEQLMEPSASSDDTETNKRASGKRGNKTPKVRLRNFNQQSKQTKKTPVHKCSVCEKCFPCASKLETHMRGHTGVKPYTCSVCDKNFALKGTLTKHMFLHSGVKPHECPVCGKLFSHKRDVGRHARMHTGEKPYKCTVCGKLFVDESYLTIHARQHTGEKPYECTVCGKSFAYKHLLTQHKRLHTGEKPFECSVCGKSFSTSSNLAQHSLTHTGEKPYECTECGKSFSLSLSLKQHKLLHTGERPYKCSVCGKTFTQSGHLSRHKRKHTDEML